MHAEQSSSPDDPDAHSTRVEFYHSRTARVRDSLAVPKCSSFPLPHGPPSEVVTLLQIKVTVGHQGAAMNHHLQGRASIVQMGDAVGERSSSVNGSPAWYMERYSCSQYTSNKKLGEGWETWL